MNLTSFSFKNPSRKQSNQGKNHPRIWKYKVNRERTSGLSLVWVPPSSSLPPRPRPLSFSSFPFFSFSSKPSPYPPIPSAAREQPTSEESEEQQKNNHALEKPCAPRGGLHYVFILYLFYIINGLSNVLILYPLGHLMNF